MQILWLNSLISEVQRWYDIDEQLYPPENGICEQESRHADSVDDMKKYYPIRNSNHGLRT
jgi:hypothetical protein